MRLDDVGMRALEGFVAYVWRYGVDHQKLQVYIVAISYAASWYTIDGNIRYEHGLLLF